ncbi:MAG TPA: DUF1150 domain-containing protein [Parvularculaceae bacterium]|nr:DUF1150 domain-containing protein [Amphiplicatus sp.]MCB9955100.1 DUF1150 domain-containing protein [Caulobacterales bacterium]HPE30570.1 DUF1150 domain-containing protein [Parvularculaceae bacterium]HRX38005.1 DUF1150 domain-containing protein [Parvularculaceae bacterium]
MAETKHIHVLTGSGANPMTAQEFAELGGRKLVYVRAVLARDVLDDLVNDEGEPIADVPEDATLYSVHAADGERIALVGDRDLAFAAARQHEMNPVSVH